MVRSAVRTNLRTSFDEMKSRNVSNPIFSTFQKRLVQSGDDKVTERWSWNFSAAASKNAGAI